MNIKNKYIEDGYVSNLKILTKDQALKISQSYSDFLNNKNLQRFERVEHKSKSHLYFDWANKIILNQKLLNIVKEILGNNFVCWNSLIFYKPPYSEFFVSAHQDQNYWGIVPDKALTVSLAITDSNKKNGCLRLLPKSHLKKFTHLDFADENNMLARGQSIKLDADLENDLVEIELEPGESVIFHSNLVHGSGANNYKNTRFLFSMRFLTTDNKVNEKLYYNNATLVSGKDNYNFFVKEPILNDENTIEDLRKLHHKIIVKQFKNYLKLKVKFLSEFFMIFFRFSYFRSILYILIKKF